jgi:hypothetical protein
MRTIIEMLKSGFGRGAALPLLADGVGHADVTAADGPLLCVHFTGRRADHSLWLAEADSAHAPGDFGGDVSVCWRRRPGDLLRGTVTFGRVLACDAVLVRSAEDTRDRLVAEGVSRTCAAVIAQMPQRPLLATFGRGPSLSPDLVRRTHRLLVAAARPRPTCAESTTLSVRSRWETLQCAWTPLTAPFAR